MKLESLDQQTKYRVIFRYHPPQPENNFDAGHSAAIYDGETKLPVLAQKVLPSMFQFAEQQLTTGTYADIYDTYAEAVHLVGHLIVLDAGDILDGIRSEIPRKHWQFIDFDAICQYVADAAPDDPMARQMTLAEAVENAKHQAYLAAVCETETLETITFD